ncbi:MAG: hypothetical protein OSB69_17370 [Alphaproteobacteria bacterium]|nr:hypothetical protein [Alphaproteobacteria bacterium]
MLEWLRNGIGVATVSGIVPANGAFPTLAIGAGPGARAPSIRDTSGLAAASVGQDSNTNANPNASPQSLTFAVRDTAFDGQNGVRLAGDNGALLDLSTSLIAQKAALRMEARPDETRR